MYHRTAAAVLAAALLVGCYGDATDDAATDEVAVALSPDEQAIDELRAYWETHYNQHHASMVASKYAEESWFLPANGGIRSGRAAIEADLAGTMENAPTAAITGVETMVMGDMGVTLGTYTVDTSPEGAEPMSFAGSYLNVMTKASGEWQILGSITNYDSARPEEWSWFEGDGEVPANEGTMGDVVDYFMTHWNMGHASMVADIYTEDAMVSFSNGPVLNGRAAIEADIEARMAEGATLTINDVGTLELSEGWAVDGGWYSIDAADGTTVQIGSYLNLMQQQEDGAWKIHWGVTNAQPAPDM